jgi:hypothetical protein
VTTRRVLAGIAGVAAAVILAVALFGFVRVRQLDAEAERIGRLWAADQGNEALAEESNEYYTAARDLEGQLPLPPLSLGGVGLIVSAAAIALWPSRASASDEPTEDLPAGH